MSEQYLSPAFRAQALAEAKCNVFAGPDNAVIAWLARLAELEQAAILLGIRQEVQSDAMQRAQDAWIAREADLLAKGRRAVAELEAAKRALAAARKERDELDKLRGKLAAENYHLRREAKARTAGAGADHGRLTEIEELRNNAAVEAEERDRATAEGKD